MRLRPLIYFFLLRNVFGLITRKPPKCLGGLELGAITLGTGLLMDTTISKNSRHQIKEKSPQLLEKGIQTSANNLLIVGPSYYYGVENWILSLNGIHNIPLEVFSLVFIHSLGYYGAHRLMHRSDLFRKYHFFHHQYNETLIPTIGNSVSIPEFTFAYMFPFVLGALIVNPGQDSFNGAIMIVSFMNLVIHTPELGEMNWNQWLVSPKTHVKHHRGENIQKTYSAPTLNWEYIYEYVKTIFKND